MKKSILIAEADVHSLSFDQQVLTACGYRVATAAGGVECLWQFRRLRPDILILDHDLPWGGGEGVLASLHAESQAPEILVILVRDPVETDLPFPAGMPSRVFCMRRPLVSAILQMEMLSLAEHDHS